MKKFNFSKLFFVAALVASFVMFSGCKPEVEYVYEQTSVVGDWISTHGEKYSISYTDYDNYADGYYDENWEKQDAGTWYLFYSTTDIVVKQLTETSGYIYGKFDDADHIGYGAAVGQWYALYYQDLTNNSVSFGQPYKAGGKAACATLIEAIEEFTIDNGYYDLSNLSECTK